MTHKPYPLDWPVGKSKTKDPVRSRFKTRGKLWTVAKAYKHLTTELERFDAVQFVISTNVELRIDGSPRSDRREPDDHGIAVYFTRLDHRGNEKPYCMAVDVYDRVADNLHALALVIESYRSIERHGGGELLEQATAGFAALPEAPETRSLTKAEKLRALAEGGETEGERAAARQQLKRLEAR